ncbi:MAG: hypothetical protein AUK37_00825 [Rhodobacterales bacterium CG2_30_65_12]|nr:MAG: hypothetical protein AUK37_00825 [Rhodobacterales bacterium CG2_30_65_12]
MNFERILSMIFRRVLGRLVNKGVDSGINLAARRGGRGQTDAGESQMTPEEHARARAAKQAAKRARQAARLTRRMR